MVQYHAWRPAITSKATLGAFLRPMPAVSVHPDTEPGPEMLDKGTDLGKILRGDADAMDQVSFEDLDTLLIPAGGLEESEIRAELGKNGELLLALMIPSQLRYWCVSRLPETDATASASAANACCGRTHARKPLRCHHESLLECSGADFVCVGDGDHICGKKYPRRVPERCSKCQGPRERILKTDGAQFLCRHCHLLINEEAYRASNGHCCKYHRVLDLGSAPYICMQCGTKYTRAGLICCRQEVEEHARYICPDCHMEHSEREPSCGKCGTEYLIHSQDAREVRTHALLHQRRGSMLEILKSDRCDCSELEVRREDVEHLDERNLIDISNKVNVKAMSLPASFKANEACDLKILTTLATKGNEALLRTKIAQAVISIAWLQFRLHTALDVFLNFLMVVCLALTSLVVRNGQRPTATLMVLMIVHGKRTFEELVQWVTFLEEQEQRGKGLLLQVLRLEAFLDLSFLIIGWLALIRRWTAPGIDVWSAAFCAWAWLKLLYSLRGEAWIGPRLLPIFYALYDALGFFVVVLVAVASASHAYYDLHLRKEAVEVVEGFWRPLFAAYTAVLQTSRLAFFGDFDLYEYEGLDPTLEPGDNGILEPVDPAPSTEYVWAHLLFFFTGIGITVLLMNLLIGVLGADFEHYEEKSSELFCRARAKMMKDIGNRPSTWFLHYFWAWWLKLASIEEEKELQGCWCKCVTILLSTSALPLRLVLGPGSFEYLVKRPLVPFARYSGCLICFLSVLCCPVIFVFSLCTLFLALLPATLLRINGLRHLLNGGLGLRVDVDGKVWCASQCGVVLFTGADDGWNGARRSFDDVRSRLKEIGEDRQMLRESLLCLQRRLGLPLTTEEMQVLASREDAKSLSEELRALSAEGKPVDRKEMETLQASMEHMKTFQEHRFSSMERRLDSLDTGLAVATERLTWACQVLYNSSRRLEQIDDTQQHLAESLGSPQHRWTSCTRFTPSEERLTQRNQGREQVTVHITPSLH